MIEFYSGAFHLKRHKRHSGKLTMLCAGLTNLDPNLGTDSEDLVITGQRWFLTLSPMLDGVMLIRFIVTSYSMSSLWPFDMWGMDVIGPISPPTSKGHQFILVITDYFSKSP